MKFLLALAFLTLSVNVNAGELSCYAEGLSKDSRTTMVKKEVLDGSGQLHETFIVKKEGSGGHTTYLYVAKSEQNQLWETVYTGTAERQVQVDVFHKFDFVVRVPKILDNGVTVIYMDNDGSGKEEMRFRCVNPDNR